MTFSRCLSEKVDHMSSAAEFEGSQGGYVDVDGRSKLGFGVNGGDWRSTSVSVSLPVSHGCKYSLTFSSASQVERQLETFFGGANV